MVSNYHGWFKQILWHNSYSFSTHFDVHMIFNSFVTIVFYYAHPIPIFLFHMCTSDTSFASTGFVIWMSLLSMGPRNLLVITSFGFFKLRYASSSCTSCHEDEANSMKNVRLANCHINSLIWYYLEVLVVTTISL